MIVDTLIETATRFALHIPLATLIVVLAVAKIA